jgi:hypothetical protein
VPAPTTLHRPLYTTHRPLYTTHRPLQGNSSIFSILDYSNVVNDVSESSGIPKTEKHELNDLTPLATSQMF